MHVHKYGTCTCIKQKQDTSNAIMPWPCMYVSKYLNLHSFTYVIPSFPDLSESEDFAGGNFQLTFDEQNDEVCTDITITNDDELEEDERFRVTLTLDGTTTTNVVLQPDTGEVTITNDDGTHVEKITRSHVNKKTSFASCVKVFRQFVAIS